MYPYNPYNAGFMQNTNQWAAQLSQNQPLQLIRVNGIEGAKAYQMPANSAVALFDGNENVFFVKTTDGAGFGSIKAFRFMPVEQTAEPQQEYISRAEFEQFKKELSAHGERFVQQRQYNGGKSDK